MFIFFAILICWLCLCYIYGKYLCDIEFWWHYL